VASAQRSGGFKQFLTQVRVAFVRALVAWVVLAGLGGWCVAVQARQGNQAADDVVALSALPVQARTTYRLILSGGPFPYPRKDGSVFGNRERQLPRHPRGYYLEYTVPTPGSRDRGARRIICGGNLPTAPEVCYYTQDHYTSFRRIVQ
jgi:ribonuclease T1